MRASYLLILLVLALGSACSSSVTESVDPEANYRWKFDDMPQPRAEVVHSRVEREQVQFAGLELRPRNQEWEFELLAAPNWVDVLRRNFLPLAWDKITYRPRIPSWFSPDPEHFTAWYLEGTSGIHSAHLFIEMAPADPQRVHIFIRRH